MQMEINRKDEPANFLKEMPKRLEFSSNLDKEDPSTFLKPVPGSVTGGKHNYHELT